MELSVEVFPDWSTVEDIKRKYPRPVRGNSPAARIEITYCVGGAFCLVNGYDAHFPTGEDLAGVLRKILPNMERLESLDIANDIIASNDKEDFADAWGILDNAVKFYG